MSHNSRRSLRAFTLIELLIVIAIIAILSSILFVNIGNTPVARTRDARRKDELRTMQKAIERYAVNNGSYPSTGGVWYSSETGDNALNGPGNNGVWIPGLVSTYLSVLPHDVRGGQGAPVPPCAGWKRSYLYRSINGTGYELLSHCAPEIAWPSSDPFYDAIRPTWAWKVCTGVECSQ